MLLPYNTQLIGKSQIEANSSTDQLFLQIFPSKEKILPYDYN